MKTKPDYLGMGLLAAVFAAYAAVYFSISDKKPETKISNPPVPSFSYEDFFSGLHR